MIFEFKLNASINKSIIVALFIIEILAINFILKYFDPDLTFSNRMTKYCYSSNLQMDRNNIYNKSVKRMNKQEI